MNLQENTTTVVVDRYFFDNTNEEFYLKLTGTLTSTVIAGDYWVIPVDIYLRRILDGVERRTRVTLTRPDNLDVRLAAETHRLKATFPPVSLVNGPSGLLQ